jgi:hypothetical protein
LNLFQRTWLLGWPSVNPASNGHAASRVRVARTPDKPNAGTLRQGGASRTCMDDEDAQALLDEGLDPNDPAVVAAIDLVRWELSLGI